MNELKKVSGEVHKLTESGKYAHEAMFFARVVIGCLFMYHSLSKFGGETPWFMTIVGIVELVSAIMILVGTKIRTAGSLLSLVMLGAIFTKIFVWGTAFSGVDVVEIKIASGGACVIVNADNPITKITREQLNGIFAITHSMTKDPIFAWKELDPTSPIGEEWIALYVSDQNSSTMQTFTDFAMPNERFTTSYFYREPSPSSVVNACCAYKTAIGVGSYRHMQPRAKALAVSGDNGKTFVAPTEMNIFTGEYPMSRPLELVAVLDKQGNLPPLLVDFARFALSETGQDEIHEDGYSPADPKKLPAFIVKAHAAAAAPHAVPSKEPSDAPNATPTVAP